MKAKKILLALTMLMLALTLQSQSITFILDTIPDYTPPEDTIFLAYFWNNYFNGDPEYALHKNSEDKWQITIAKPEGFLSNGIWYYFTRGSEKTRERGPLDLANAYASYASFTPTREIKVSIENWYDRPGKPSTTSWNVSRISDNFPIPQLGRTRGISIYLPPDYHTSNNSYPVIYLQDGQEAFDLYTSYDPKQNEWGVDEVLNEMASEGIKVPIVVAIDHSDNRADELIPWIISPSSGPSFGGEGDKYIDFMTNTLKPYIDSSYRTLPEPENSCIMGSSLGGQISIYGALRRPDVFRKAGIFSPAYHHSDSVWLFIRNAERVHPMRIYQLVGSTEETNNFISNVEKMDGILGEFGYSDEEIKYKIVEGGEHHRFVGSEFRETYLWLFPEATSSARKEPAFTSLAVYPNPVQNNLYIETPLPDEDISIHIYNIAGALVKSENKPAGNRINVGDLPGGLYVLRVSGRTTNYTGKLVKE